MPRPLGRKAKNYGKQRAKQIATFRLYLGQAREIIRQRGSITATFLTQNGIPRNMADRVLTHLEQQGEHIPPPERVRAQGQRAVEAIKRREKLKASLDSGAQISDILTLTQYSGKSGTELLASDLNAIRKYYDPSFSIRMAIPANPRVARMIMLIKENPNISQKELAKNIGVSTSTIRDLLTLVSDRIKNLRIFPGSRFSVGELRSQNITILIEYLKGTKLKDIAEMINKELAKKRSPHRLTMTNVAHRLKYAAKPDEDTPRRASGPTQYTKEQLAIQNKEIKNLAKTNIGPAEIARLVTKKTGMTVTGDQVYARLAWWKKRGLI